MEDPMFGKKPEDGDKPQPPETPEAKKEEEAAVDTLPLKPFSRKGTHVPHKPPGTTYRAEIPRRNMDIPGPGGRSDRARAAEEDPKRLVVGRDIRLKGEITACERLVVEGEVEVSISGAKLIEVMPTGLFKGDVDVDKAEISGRFHGNLTARDQLTVRSGGRVEGAVRYGRIVIEAGGEVSGDMRSLTEGDGGES